ncbi:MAG: type IV secretion system protein VirB11 [Alphaproteobacteria bacterium]|nr:MAG: type IV secretion system protein VirB11 [Caulobacteraceae bacterium]TPW01676.1 MAG: type IV secretion system protein VirB11 [Alphaproteobacteria bacterium]
MTSSATAMPAPFLADALAPFARWLDDPQIIEILVDRSGAFWIERAGDAALEEIADPRITQERLVRLARLVAASSAQRINTHHPLLSASLPSQGGERIQFLLPPAARHGVAMAIRKQVVVDRSLADYAADGAFDGLEIARTAPADPADADLRALARRGDVASFLESAVAARKTILISGATSSGKTALLNALLAKVPAHERIVTIEDAPELRPPHRSVVSLIASRGDQGDAAVSPQALLEAALRLRPDRILLGELRGGEAFAFLRAVNTGHPGSLTTVHADSPESAYEQIALMALQSGVALSRADVLAYVRSIVRIVVQTARIGGRRVISAVHYADL